MSYSAMKVDGRTMCEDATDKLDKSHACTVPPNNSDSWEEGTVEVTVLEVGGRCFSRDKRHDAMG